MIKTHLITKRAIRLQCHRCEHIWDYTGNNEFQVSCPHCSTKLGMKKILKQIKSESDANHIGPAIGTISRLTTNKGTV